MAGLLETVGERFAAERARLKLGVQATADKCGVTRGAITKIERGAMPSGGVLQGFGSAGADVQYVLTGTRSGVIDETLFGMVEAAIRDAYRETAGDQVQVERLKATQVAKAYNAAIRQLTPETDTAWLARRVADALLLAYTDPSDPQQLERNLLRPASVPAAAGATITVTGGKGQRIAGRDFVTGKKGG